MLTDIFLIRHATPLQNTGVAYRTMPGPDLSDHGRQEARLAAAFLADKALEHLFVSPFARTTQTAEQILEQLDLPVTFSQLITENPPDESADKVRARIREFLNMVMDASCTRIGVVSHGNPIQVFIQELGQGQIDLKQYVFSGNNPAPPAGIWHARRDGEGWRLELAFQPGQAASM